jgi:hypothetical protein
LAGGAEPLSVAAFGLRVCEIYRMQNWLAVSENGLWYDRKRRNENDAYCSTENSGSFILAKMLLVMALRHAL